MYVLVKNNAVEKYPYSEAMLKNDNPGVTFPKTMTLAGLAGWGVYPVTETEYVPPAGSRAVELPPAKVGQQWVQQWTSVAMTAAELNDLRGARIAEIKSIRDAKIHNDGYQVNGKWYHSDTTSRIQQLGLVMMGASMPGGLQWKTMDGSFVTMTPTLASQIFAAAAAKDQALFAYAETLIGQVMASNNPDAVNITSGWPAGFVSA